MKDSAPKRKNPQIMVKQVTMESVDMVEAANQHLADDDVAQQDEEIKGFLPEAAGPEKHVNVVAGTTNHQQHHQHNSDIQQMRRKTLLTCQ